MNKLVVHATVLFALLSADAHACTIVMVSDSTVSLAGSNEDSVFPLTLLWYVTATKNSYGRVCLGYNMAINSVQGGMNERGLFVDGNSLGKQGWRKEENKEAVFGSVLDHLLATCASVEDVKEFFHAHNVQALDVARIPVMDKSGASLIVEWHDGGVVFLESDQAYQISTNFIESKFVGKEKPCWRYNRAVEILEAKDSFSISDVRDVLDATHVAGNRSTTVYSFICDLLNGEIHVYNYHDFTRSVTISLEDELSKGQHEQYLGALFTDRTTDYDEFIKAGPVQMIERGCGRNVNMGLFFFELLKAQYPKVFHNDIGIETLSRVGTGLITRGALEDGITILERNALEFPDSARSHFELGSAYMKADNSEGARTEYEKTLAIEPTHKEASQAVEDLR